MKVTVRQLRQFIREADEVDPFEEQERLRKERWDAEANRPEVKPLLDAIRDAQNPKELARAKRAAVKADDDGIIAITGVWMNVYKQRKQEIDDMGAEMKDLNDPNKTADARMDRLLRTRTSSGKAIPRKF